MALFPGTDCQRVYKKVVIKYNGDFFDLALIFNLHKPGTIGSIGATLGENGINMSRMQVGQDEDGVNNIVFLKTDTPIPITYLRNCVTCPW